MFDSVFPSKFEITLTIKLPDVVAAIVANNATLQQVLSKVSVIQSQGEKIMSAIGDFITASTTFMDTMEAGIDGIAGDVTGLKDDIAALQASLGESPTPEQIAAMQALTVRQTALATKTNDLDAQTPPKAPAQP